MTDLDYAEGSKQELHSSSKWEVDTEIIEGKVLRLNTTAMRVPETGKARTMLSKAREILEYEAHRLNKEKYYSLLSTTLNNQACVYKR